MRFITDRKAIAKAINIEGLPVVTIDITKGIDDLFVDSYKGSGIKVNCRNSKYPARCKVMMFGDEDANKGYHSMPYMYGKIILSGAPICISSDFGPSDVREMVYWSNCQTVNPGDHVIVVFDKGNGVVLREMKVGEHTDAFCQTVAVLEDVVEDFEVL